MSRKNRRTSTAKAAIEAALKIAREHAELIEAAAKRNADHDVANVPASPVTK